MFNALVLDKGEDDKVTSSIKQLEDGDLPEGDVTIDVAYSTLNYKDGLVLEGLGGLVRNYPHVPGIDFSGTVAESKHSDFKTGDKVILTGWRVGEARWGGYSQRARVKATGWYICLRVSTKNRPWPLARQALPQCSPLWPSKHKVSPRTAARYW